MSKSTASFAITALGRNGVIFMKKNQIKHEAIFAHPFSKDYLRAARAPLSSTRFLCAAALLCAIGALLEVFYIPVGGAFLRITFTYLAQMLLGVICGPIYSVIGGVLIDVLGFLLAGGDAAGYFPGFTLSAALQGLLYALFLYRAKLSVWRVLLAKLTVNVAIHVILGSVWKQMLYGKAYHVYFVSGAIKNIAMLPIEVFISIALLHALAPAMTRLGLLPKQEIPKPKRRDTILFVIAMLLGATALILYYRYKMM